MLAAGMLRAKSMALPAGVQNFTAYNWSASFTSACGFFFPFAPISFPTFVAILNGFKSYLEQRTSLPLS